MSNDRTDAEDRSDDELLDLSSKGRDALSVSEARPTKQSLSAVEDKSHPGKAFGPSGPPAKEMSVTGSFDISRDAISRDELASLTEIASEGDRSAYNSFDWKDGSNDHVRGSAAGELATFHNMDALSRFIGLYDYSDGSRLWVILNSRQQAVKYEAKIHNSEAERRMHEVRAHTLDWEGRKRATRSPAKNGLIQAATAFSVLAVIYSLLYVFGFYDWQSSGDLTWSGIVVGILTGVVAASVPVAIDRYRSRGRAFVIKHPQRRQWNHDQIQSWGSIIGVVVAIFLFILGQGLGK